MRNVTQSRETSLPGGRATHTREGAVDRSQVAGWLRRYVESWKSYDRAQIGELFSEGAEYRYHPYDDPVWGRDAIVESWFEDPDPAATYDGSYEPVAVDGDTAVAVGHSTYLKEDGSIEKVYDNCYVMRFDGDGRCREFTEFYMLRSSGQGAV
jgi:SnoaL-like protein